MRRIIVIVALLAVVGIGGYLFIFKREALLDMGSSARGYPKAKTAQECCDLFQKALRERDYKMAARYCTNDYAEQLKRGNDAAKELGKSIDGVMHRVTSELSPDDGQTKEIEAALSFYDPFPKNVKITLKDANDKDGVALIGFEGPVFNASGASLWENKKYPHRVFCFEYPAAGLKLVKQSDGWKVDLPVSANFRVAVENMNGNYKVFASKFDVMAEELRIERTTKSEPKKRLLELVAEANNSK